MMRSPYAYFLLLVYIPGSPSSALSGDLILFVFTFYLVGAMV